MDDADKGLEIDPQSVRCLFFPTYLSFASADFFGVVSLSTASAVFG
jgi:hypothetical protein